MNTMLMTIPELEKEIKQTDKAIDRLNRALTRLDNALSKRLATRYNVKRGDLIVGKAVVFNKTRNIVAEVHHVQKAYSWTLHKTCVYVVAFTAGDKRYEFNIKEVRRAKPLEIMNFKARQKKWLAERTIWGSGEIEIINRN